MFTQIWSMLVGDSDVRRVTHNIPAAVATMEPRRLLSATATPEFTVNPAAKAHPNTTAAQAGYSPSQIDTAYNWTVTANSGKGETIAIVDAYNDPNIQGDLAVFDAQYGIAAPPSFLICNQVGYTGAQYLPGNSQDWGLEETLDVEWAHAQAPAANIIYVGANSASLSDMYQAVNEARSLGSTTVVSMSWGSNDNAAYSAQDHQYANYVTTPAGHQGVTFVAASGDTGSVVLSPSSFPNVVSVGGTDLNLNANNSINYEMGWSGSGGGVSQEFGGYTPLVSFDSVGWMAIYDTDLSGSGGIGYPPGWMGIGGTSAGAPQWAGLIADADQARAARGLGSLTSPQTVADLYSAASAANYANDFHDIKYGNSGLYSAGPGYDFVTGLGTPYANSLINYMATGASLTHTAAPVLPTMTGTTVVTATPAPAAAGDTTSVTVKWTKVANATGYVVESYDVSAYAQGWSDFALVGANVTSITDNSPYPGDTVEYRVVATNGTQWTTSATVTVTTNTNVLTILDCGAYQYVSGELLIYWYGEGAASSYSINELINGQYVDIFNQTSAGTGYNFYEALLSFTPGKTYTFEIGATTNGLTSYSAPFSATA